mgnify:CR=1 FL=1
MTSIDDVIRLLEAAKKSETRKSTKGGSDHSTKRKKRGPSAYNKRYSRAFKSLAPKYKTKKGAWKKNGYRQCVRAAHRKARK